MKRSIRTLIIAVLVLAVLCGAYFLADKWKPGGETAEEDKTDSSGSETIYIVNEKTEDVASVDIFTGETSYTVKNGGDSASIEGYSSNIISQSSLESLLSSCASVVASKKITMGDNSLEDYGLDTKTRRIALHLKNGTDRNIIIGSSAYIDGEYYAMDEENNQLYTISSYTADDLTKSPDSLRDMAVCTIDNTTVEALTVKKSGAEILAIKKEETENTEKAEKEDSATQIQNYVMTYPYQMKASADKIRAIVEKLGSITASEIVEENPADLSKYGLSKGAEIIVKDASGSHSLRLGAKQGDNVYMMYNGLPVVYLAPCEFYDDVQKASAEDFVDRFIHIFNIDTVKKIEIEQGGNKRTLSIKGDTTKDGKATYMVDGKKIEESKFKGIYQAVIGITLADVQSFTPSGQPSATIKFSFNDGTEKTFSYYTVDERYSYVKSDSGLDCVTLTKNITAIEDEIKEVK